MNAFRSSVQKTASTFWLAITFLCTFSLWQAYNLKVQTSAAVPFSDQQTLQTVLREVQQTRFTVERSMTIIYRSQKLLSEIRLHYEQANSLQKDLNQLRAEAADSQSEYRHQTERLDEVSAQIAKEQDAQRLESLRAEEREIRLLIQENIQDEALRQERENQVIKNQRVEQAKLEELNRQVEIIEREIATPATRKR